MPFNVKDTATSLFLFYPQNGVLEIVPDTVKQCEYRSARHGPVLVLLFSFLANQNLLPKIAAK